MSRFNLAKTTETIPLETIRYAQPSQDPSAALIEVESSTNRQSDPIGEFNGESYQHYWSMKTFEALKLESTFDTKFNTCIEEELIHLNGEGWNNLKDFLNPVGPQRVTIVHLAAYEGKIDILERAVELYKNEPIFSTSKTNGKIADPWLAADKFARCALHYAALKGHGDVVSWILDKWISEHSTPHPQISLKDVFGRTPLSDAVGRLNVDVVRLLVDAGAAVVDPNRRRSPAFLPLKEDSLSSWNYPVGEASRRYFDIIKFLFEKITDAKGQLTIDINFGHPKTCWTMLHHAISLKSHETVKYLVKCGADPNLNATDKRMAADCGYSGWFTKLRNCRQSSRYGTPREDGLSALQYAALESDFESVRILLDNGGNLAKPYLDSSRTVIEDLRILTDDRDILNFLSNLSYAHLKVVPEARLVTINYGILAPEKEPRQMAVISVLIKALKCEELHIILKHPLLQAYIGKQWLRFSKLFYSFVVLYTFFVISLSWYTIHLVNNNSDSATLRRLMLFSACILSCCHLLQFLAEPKWYSKQAETWIFFFSLTLPIIVAINGESVSNASTSWVLHTLSVVFPLAGIRIILFLGRVVFLPWGHYALLLSIVLRSVLKVLAIGLFIVAGFSLSFFILFHNNDQFSNPWKALAKTIVMMTGEYDYGELFSATATNNSFDHNHDSREEKDDNLPFVTGRIIFIFFVIITGIVLMNLMIGLAVSDVQALVDEGKLDRLLKQAVFIAHCEQTMLKNYVLNCLCKTWIKSTKIKSREVILLHKPRPPGISEEVWRDIFRLYKKNESGTVH